MKRVVSGIVIVLILATVIVALMPLSCNIKSGYEHDLCVIDKIDTFGLSSYCENTQDKASCYNFYARIKGDTEVCTLFSGDIRDNCLVQAAITKQDVSVCSSVASKDIKNICQKEVVSRTYDDNICQQIEPGSAFGRDECYLLAGVGSRDEHVCIRTAFKDECYYAIGMDTKDPALCDRVGDRSLAEYCKMTLGSDCEEIRGNDIKAYCKAERSHNLDYCTSIINPELQFSCLSESSLKDPALCEKTAMKGACYEQAALSTSNASYCEKTSAVDLCKKKLATQTKDESLCAGLSDEPLCYHDVAVASNNPSLCEKAGGDSNDKAVCIYEVAVKAGSKELCSGIVSDEKRQACEIQVAIKKAITEHDASQCQNDEQCIYAVAQNTSDYRLCRDAGSKETSCYHNLLAKKQAEYIPADETHNSSYLNYCSFYTDISAEKSWQDMKIAACEMKLSRDYKLCEGIDNEYKGACYENLIELTFKSSVCAEMESKDEQKLCYEKYAIALNDPALCSKTADETDCILKIAEGSGIEGTKELQMSLCAEAGKSEDECGKEVGIRTSDITICSQIQSPQLQSECFLEIAKKESNSEICAEISTFDLQNRDTCYQAVAIKTGDKELCKELNQTAERYACFESEADYGYALWMQEDCTAEQGTAKAYCQLRTALKSKNADDCGQISINEIKDICYRESSKDTLQSSCAKISYEPMRNSCHYIISDINKDYTECMQITIPSQKNRCLNNAAFLTSDKTACGYYDLSDSVMNPSKCGELYY